MSRSVACSFGFDSSALLTVGVGVDRHGHPNHSQHCIVRFDNRAMLSFQRLDVYRCAIEFLALAMDLTTRLPKCYAALADQFRRAALSVPLNIAEAAGRTSEADAARHHAIARGSAMECAAIVDALALLSVMTDAEHHKAAELLARSVAMLTKLCR